LQAARRRDCGASGYGARKPFALNARGYGQSSFASQRAAALAGFFSHEPPALGRNRSALAAISLGAVYIGYAHLHRKCAEPDDPCDSASGVRMPSSLPYLFWASLLLPIFALPTLLPMILKWS
jgi:hypothetical protein